MLFHDLQSLVDQRLQGSTVRVHDDIVFRIVVLLQGVNMAVLGQLQVFDLLQEEGPVDQGSIVSVLDL